MLLAVHIRQCRTCCPPPPEWFGSTSGIFRNQEDRQISEVFPPWSSLLWSHLVQQKTSQTPSLLPTCSSSHAWGYKAGALCAVPQTSTCSSADWGSPAGAGIAPSKEPIPATSASKGNHAISRHKDPEDVCWSSSLSSPWHLLGQQHWLLYFPVGVGHALQSKSQYWLVPTLYHYLHLKFLHVNP